MRSFTESCLRNLQDRQRILGFEEFDLFIVLGIFMTLHLFKVNGCVSLTFTGVVAGLLLFIKRGKPAKTVEHCLQWFFKAKQYTAVPQSIIEVIKGRGVDIRLNALQEILPYSHMEDGFLIFKDDSLSVGYSLDCPYAGNLSGEELIRHSAMIETFLNNLTEKASYQVIFDFDGHYRDVIEEHSEIKTNNRLIRAMHAHRLEKLKDIEDNGTFRRPRCFLFVNFAGGENRKRKGAITQSFKKFKDVCEEDVRRLKTEFIRILELVEGGLRSGRLSFRRLNEQECMRFVYDYLNPDRVQAGLDCPSARKYELLPRQVCCSDFSVDSSRGEYMHWGGQYHKFITLKIVPESTYPIMLRALSGLSFKQFDVIVNFEAPPKEWGKKTIESLRRREYGNLLGMMGITNKDAEVKIQQYETLLEEIQQTNQKLFRAQLTLHVYSDTLEEVSRNASEVIRLFSGMNGAEMHDERYGGVVPIFLSTLPGWTKESSRWILLKTLHLSDLLPLYSDFYGSGRGETIFFNTTQGLAAYDPFASDLPAFNSILVGPAGSGKSFLVNQIINQYSKNDAIEVFIDIGGSYKRQVSLKGGEYINLGLKEKFTINLFDLPGGKKFSEFSDEEQNEILVMKTKIIEQMVGKTSRFAQSDQIVEDFISRSIRHLYNTVEYPVLSDFKTALTQTAKNNDQWLPFVHQITGLLGIWLSGGQFGAFTDGRSTISFDKSIVCFDLKGLENQRLQTTMLTIITNFVWGKFMSERGRRKLLILDECWKLLATPEAAGFIAEAFRTFRKYGAGAISVTQSLSDFTKGGLEDAILGNAHTRFILSQNSAPILQGIVDYFRFNEQEKHQIESLKIQKGEGAEVFFSQAKGLKPVSGTIVIYPTPVEYWVATTDALDIACYEKVQADNPGLSMYDVILKCAEEYPRGVSYTNK
ncbi:MAG TPA: ATP-binding protein [Candidatus Omnitrophota bacterium]|nr:ATP-binding protein [Candidatus Omnitrophota bacterium]